VENHIDEDLRRPKRKKWGNQDSVPFQFNSNELFLEGHYNSKLSRNLEAPKGSTAKPTPALASEEQD
jgi:hypothetical protein